MILTGKEDLRIQKTIEAIQTNFKSLILEKDFLKISVTELCGRAKISKKSFYAYYESLEDLLLEMQDMISSEYRERIKNYTLKDMDKLVREFFIFSEEKGEFYEKITCGGSYAQIREKMIRKVNQNQNFYPELSKLPQDERTIVEAYVKETMLSIYRTWIENGKKPGVEKIITLATQLITNGLGRF